MVPLSCVSLGAVCLSAVGPVVVLVGVAGAPDCFAVSVPGLSAPVIGEGPSVVSLSTILMVSVRVEEGPWRCGVPILWCRGPNSWTT